MRRRITSARREEIEKEQRILDSTIVRPFETLENLPISYNPPPHENYEEVIKNPLTIKDSAVLYTALMRSRNTYVYHAPMLKLYWVKQTAYAKKLAEMEKENEAIRDRDTKRRFSKATSSSLETRTRTPVLSTDVNARDVMSKLCEASLTVGPHSMDIRIFIAKDARSEKSKAFAEISKVTEDEFAQHPLSYHPVGYFAPLPSVQPADTSATAPAPSQAGSKSGTPAEVKVEDEANEKEELAETQVAKPGSAATTVEESPKKGAKKSAKPPTAATTVKQETKPAPKPAPKPASGSPNQDSAPSGPPKPPPANLQSIENTIMISNLNAIATTDPSLNDLMKKVALGNASEEQINLFKRYIDRAKQMGPQPHHAELYYSRNLPLPPEFPRPHPLRDFVERRPPRPRIPNPLKLTAFQEKYLYNATLVFEFLENPNVRYVIPRDSVCEILPPLLPPPPDAEEDIEYRDMLISTIWIHNIDEVEAYERKLGEYNLELQKRKEEEERLRKDQQAKEEQEAKEAAEGTEEQQPEERNFRAGVKKKAPLKKKKELEPPIEPNYRYTTYSFTLHNIPVRFVAIVANSMRPLAYVQNRMANILKKGTRTNSFYLWYQVDAKLDEKLAERLRHDLVQEEKKVQGILPPGAGVDPKKRKLQQQKNAKLRKMREAAPSYMPTTMALREEATF